MYVCVQKAVAVVAPRQTVTVSPIVATTIAPITTPVVIAAPVAIEEKKAKIEPEYVYY